MVLSASTVHERSIGSFGREPVDIERLSPILS